MGFNDLVSVFGERATDIKQGIIALGQLDQVVIPMTEGQGRTDTLNSMSGVLKRKPKVLATGEVDMDNYVDKAKTKPLNSAELLGHLGAVRLMQDQVTLQASPDWNILNLAMVEGHLASQAVSESLIPPEMNNIMSRKEVSDLTGVDESDIKSPISNGQLGRTITEEWVKMRQRAIEGPEAVIDAHLNPDNELTKEAYEQLGIMAKQTYALAQPGIYQGVEVTTASGMTKTDYQLTAPGMEMLSRMQTNLLEPKIVARPQVTVDAKPTTQNATKTKEYTGFHYEAKIEKGVVVAEEAARSNLASVRHVVNNVRLKAGMLMGLSGIQAASKVKVLTEEELGKRGLQDSHTAGMIVVDGQAGDMMGIGQKAADKINYASRNAGYSADIVEMEWNNTEDPGRQIELEEQMDILRTFQIKSNDPEWRMRMYNRQANRSLQMLQDIAEFKDDPISFTNYLQKGTSRIGYSAQVMNMQNNKMARQMYGSGNVYSVTPGSHSNAEWAMLVTMGSHFFEETNNVPEKTYQNMRDRIKNGDSKLLGIAAVGRKLSALLDGYNVDSTVDALRKMDTVDNRISGVKDAVETGQFMVDDADVKAFLTESFKHENEVVNLIEEAIELGRYMDSIKAGNKPFESSMRPIEVDGISNGLAALTAQLGIESVMYRIGVLRQDPDKVLAEFKGIEGNIRLVLAKNMRTSIDGLLQDENVMKEFDLTMDNKDEILGILELAIQQEKPFLKQPLMTLPYGQAIASMGGLMLEAITSSPALTEIANRERGMGVSKMSKLLHVILERNLNDTLGQPVSEFADAVKEMTDVAMAANEPIRFRKATGTWTSMNTSSQVAADRNLINSRIMETWNEKLADGTVKRRGKEVSQARFRPTDKTLSATGLKDGGASAIKTGILAQAVISMDGSTMASTLSGEQYKRLQYETSQSTPYVTAIYDAILGDLGSLKPLMEGINRTWINNTLNFDLIGNLIKGAESAQARGATKIAAAAKADPNGYVSDREQSNHIMASIASDLRTKKGKMVSSKSGESAFFTIQGAAAGRFNSLTNSQRKTLRISSPWDMITNSELNTLYSVITPSMDQKISNMKDIAHRASQKRNQLKKKIGNNPVFQYHVDAIKSFRFP